LRRLEGEGLVEVSGDKAVSVVPLTPRELSELRLLRLRLDPLAASLAAKATTDQRAHLGDLAALPLATVDVLAWHTAHRGFHRAIHDMADNRVLADTLEHIWERLDRYRLLARTDVMGDSSLGVSHADIAEAVIQGDSEAAERLTFTHLRSAFGDENGSMDERFGAAARQDTSPLI
jgi:DNA-binding GntR family transcriptional regulator